MRLGKRERAAITAKRQARNTKIARNLKGLAALGAERSAMATLYVTPAYAFKDKTERHTLYGNVRVMHNAKGSESVSNPHTKKRFASK